MAETETVYRVVYAGGAVAATLPTYEACLDFLRDGPATVRYPSSVWRRVSAGARIVRSQRIRASGIDWRSRVPPGVAMRQEAWERARTVLRISDGGATLAEIAVLLGVSEARARQIVVRASERMTAGEFGISPVDAYLRRCAELVEVTSGEAESHRREAEAMAVL